MSVSTDAQEIKRKPGRPRKTPVKPPAVNKGILEDPVGPGNIVEFKYSKPTIFKKIGSQCNSFSSETVTFLFTPASCKIYIKDYHDCNDAEFTFEGADMDSYYCAKECEIHVQFENLGMILEKLDAKYIDITFATTEAELNSYLFLKLNHESNIPEHYILPVIMVPDNVKEYSKLFIYNPAPYALEFSLSGAYFRKLINDMKHFDKLLTIEKNGNAGNFMFSYLSLNKQVQVRCIPKADSDICLVSRLKEDEIFSVSIFSNNIKPTSSNQLAEKVHIRASKDSPLWIYAELDGKSVYVNILTKLLNYKEHIDEPMQKRNDNIVEHKEDDDFGDPDVDADDEFIG